MHSKSGRRQRRHQEGAGFDADTNVVTLFLRDGREIPLPKLTKFEVANRILDAVLTLHQ